MTERLYTTPEAAAELDVPPSLILVWRHRHRAMPAGLLPGPVLMWRLDELRPLAEAYHLRRMRRLGNTS